MVRSPRPHWRPPYRPTRLSFRNRNHSLLRIQSKFGRLRRIGRDCVHSRLPSLETFRGGGAGSLRDRRGLRRGVVFFSREKAKFYFLKKNFAEKPQKKKPKKKQNCHSL